MNKKPMLRKKSAKKNKVSKKAPVKTSRGSASASTVQAPRRAANKKPKSMGELNLKEQYLANWLGSDDLSPALEGLELESMLPTSSPDGGRDRQSKAKKISATVDKDLYLIRSRNSSAAQALSRAEVHLNEHSRSKQLGLLKEYISDTKYVNELEIKKWISDHNCSAARDSNGSISTGVVVALTNQEALEINREVGDLTIVRNRALGLIRPVEMQALGKVLPKTPDVSWHLDAIGMVGARKSGKAFSGNGVTIAVLDTGVQMDHPELLGRVSSCWKIKDGVTNIDFTSLEVDKSHKDTDGHGTHVAGLICGKNVGVATDASVISVLMMPMRRATTFDFVRCLDWAAENPEISLVNLSAGLTPFTADLMPFISDLLTTGVLPIMAIGNDGSNNTRSPANYIDGASIGSVDAPGNRVSSFSGSGQLIWNQTIYDTPDFVAPGGQVWSAFRDSNYVAMSGTSMATPIATGIAACLIEQAGGLITPLELLDLMKKGAKKLEGEVSARQGTGLLKVPLRA